MQLTCSATPPCPRWASWRRCRRPPSARRLCVGRRGRPLPDHVPQGASSPPEWTPRARSMWPKARGWPHRPLQARRLAHSRQSGRRRWSAAPSAHRPARTRTAIRPRRHSPGPNRRGTSPARESSRNRRPPRRRPRPHGPRPRGPAKRPAPPTRPRSSRLRFQARPAHGPTPSTSAAGTRPPPSARPPRGGS